MTELRAQKVMNISEDIPKTEILGNKNGDLLILSWEVHMVLVVLQQKDYKMMEKM